jgi:flagellar basal body rod protein FlgG
MLENKKGFTLSPLVKRFLLAFVGVAVVLTAVYFYLNRERAPLAAPNTNVAGAGAVQKKSTAFDGKNINVDDPQALRAYCEDIIQEGKASGDQIRDLCVLNDIVRKHLPTLSSEEIEDLAYNQPSCLQTGYDAEGFNCFTGMDENNCSKEGLDAAGNVCNPSIVRNVPVVAPTAEFDEAKICSIVSGCQAESEFDENGMNRFGCNREGRREDGTMCPAEYITRLYGDDNLDQLGFSPAGMNKYGCDIQGLRENGDRCPLEQVTQVFDRDNFDQWGFNPKGFNEHGCSMEGLDSEGNVCPIENITRVVDPKTNRDQFGLTPEGYNEAGCGLDGYDKEGKICKLEDMPLIFGKDGKNQHGLFKNGRNEHGCGLDGLDEEALACDISKAPRLFSSKTGKDQFNFHKNDRNDAGCDPAGMRANGSICSIEDSTKIIGEDGLDANKISLDGYAKNGCNLKGFRRNGARCSISEIPRIVNPLTKLDQFGLDEDGFDPKTNCNLEGFNRDGERCSLADTPLIFDEVTKLNQFGFLNDGYNQAGCDINGLNRMGQVCAPSDITRVIDPVTKLDQFGLDEDGFNPETNCNLLGFNRQGFQCDFNDIPQIFGNDGKNQLGLTKDGRNSAGCDLNGLKPNGEVCSETERTQLYGESGMGQYHRNEDGFSRLGINEMQYNEFNCNIDGQRPDGSLCPIDEITRVYDPITKLDQFGLTKSGFNEYGCSLEGKDELGNACKPEHIPRIYSSEMKDQFGTSIADLPDEVWLAEQAKKEGLVPLLDEDGNPVFKDGKAVMVANDGTLRDKDGVAFRDKEGNVLSVTPDNEIINSKGKLIPTSIFKNQKGESVSGALSPAKPIAKGNKRLSSKNGDDLFVDGKAAYVDENGYIVDENGDYITGEDGSIRRLDENGDVVDSEGNVIPASSIRNKKGQVVDGPFKTKSQHPKAKLSSLVSSTGEPVMIDGKLAYVDENGNLTDSDGNVLLGEDGKPLSLSSTGDVVNSSGENVDPRRLTKLDGKLIEGPFKSAVKPGLKTLTDANGETVMIDGRPAYVGKNGVITDAQGNPIRGSDGKPLRLNDKNEIVDSQNRRIRSDRLKNAAGKVLTGPFKAVDKASRSVLTDAQGNPVLLDGKAAFIDEDGNVVNAQGEIVVGKDGLPLKLNSKGEIVDSSGIKVDAERLTYVDGKLANKPLKSKNSISQDLLLDGDGNPVLVDGELAYVDNKGNIRKANGELILDEDGEPLKLNENNQVVGKDGKPISRERLTTVNGERVSGVLSVDKATATAKYTPLLDSEGNVAMLNGKPVMVNNEGKLTDEFGNELRGPNGEPLMLNESGQVVSESGSVIPSSYFQNALGEEMEGTFTSSPDVTESQLEALIAAQKLTPQQRKELGISEDGYSATGCDLNGLDRNAKLCAFEDIPKVYDPVTKLDQFGFGEDSYNSFGCDFYGLNRQNERCDDKFITRLRGADGFDQFGVSDNGLKASGLNSNSENALGCDPTGLNCSELNTPLLTDGGGANQFGTKSDGSDRLNLVNGFNDKGCNIDGLNAIGERCAIEDIPLYYGDDGINQFGVMESGFNENGCGFDGIKIDGTLCNLNEIPRIFDDSLYDQFDLNSEGRNAAGCGLNGFMADGSRCAIEDIPFIYDANDFNQFGIGKDSFNEKGCDLEGYHRDGSRCDFEDISKIYDPVTGLDQFNMNSEGYNLNGCDLAGRNKTGELCSFENVTRIFDKVTGKDQFGFFPDGYNDKGCNYYGYNKENEICEPENITRITDIKGVDQLGIDSKTQRNKFGCDINGVKADGTRCKIENTVRFLNSEGKDRHGFVNGVNENGCNAAGLKPDGTVCELKEITQIIDEETGMNQWGLRPDGTNEHGCNLDGIGLDGEPCPIENIPHIFGEDGLDHLHLNESGRNVFDCNLLGFKSDGTRCSYDELTKIRGDSGKDQLNLFVDGFDENNEDIAKYDRNGCDVNNRDRDGKMCSKNKDLGLDVNDGVYIAERKEKLKKWLATMSTEMAYKQPVSSAYSEESLTASNTSTNIASNGAPVRENSSNQKPINIGDGKASEASKESLMEDIRIPMAYMTQVHVTTPVNSDYTNTVYAKITLGELAGAVLVGRPVIPYIEDAVMPRDKFYYEFTSMIYERQTIAIDAISINPYNDSSMVDADDVDYHRFQRYFGLVVASAVEALDATYLDNEVESDLEDQAALLSSLTTSTVLYGENSRDLLQSNLQTATSHISDLAQQQFTRRPTITSGPGLTLIVFRKANTDPRIPYVLVGVEH